MATHIGIGFSQEPNTSNASRDAALQAKAQIKQKTVDFTIVFTTPHYSPLETLRVIRQILPQAKTIGCSTAGIILAQSVEMRGIAVLAITSDDFKFGIGCAEDLASADMRVAGAELARATVMDFGQNRRGAFIVFSDGLLRNSAPLVKGAQEIFGRVFPVVGAGSSDNLSFRETYQFFQDKPMTNSATATLLGGQIRIGVGNRHGWKPLGKPRFVKKSEGNIIKTIDDKRATHIYEEYLGLGLEELQSRQFIHTAMLYPLGLYIEGEKEYLLRTVVAILSDGSMVCQGDVPEESEVHLMISNKDFCHQAAIEATHEALDTLSGRPPRLAIIFESLSRQKLLGRDIVQEIQAVREILSPATPIIGMYSYGEIAPLKSMNHIGEAIVQNGTIVVLTVA